MRNIKTLLLFTGLLLAGNCPAEVQVIDDLGRLVTLTAPAQRIVSLAPHNTENLFTAGAGDLVVGTVDHSDFPPPALDIPRIGNYKQINFEAVLKLKPDLVIAWSSGNPDNIGRRLEELGFPVFYSESTSFERIISNIERFGQLTGRSIQARRASEDMRTTIARLKRAYAGKTAVTVFYQVWNQPLITLNGQHAVSRALELCGGVNIFANEATIAPRINIEGVISRNPQLILLAGHDSALRLSWLENWNQWPAIQAVKDGQIKYVNPDIINRPTRRFVDATGEICELIDAARR